MNETRGLTKAVKKLECAGNQTVSKQLSFAVVHRNLDKTMQEGRRESETRNTFSALTFDGFFRFSDHRLDKRKNYQDHQST
jgi:hypothetical protein